MIPLIEMQKVKIFTPLSEKMIEELAAIGEVSTAKKGEYLFHKGNPADDFFILKEGQVVLEFENPDGSSYTEVVNPGMGVGCSALAGLRKYMSHGRCEEDCRFVHWKQADLRELFDKHPRLGYLLIRASAKTLTKRVAAKTQKSSVQG